MRTRPKLIDWTRFSSLVTRAIASGSSIADHSIAWDVSNGCNHPFEKTLASAPPKSPFGGIEPVIDCEVRWIDISTPCRKCEVCLENRRKLWRGRARSELVQANRTWFCTFTINPHWRFILSCRSGSLDYLDSYAEISKEMTKFFKRLRKAGYKFRYLMVAEAHKDGYPHIHMLLHERSTPIVKSRLQAEWPLGFTNVKLVENNLKALNYVSKYMSKDARTRIRASERYGLSVRDLSLEMEHLLKR